MQMKETRTYILIAISSIALIIVLIIQVNWILQSAQIKEELFNEKANRVVTRTAEVLSTDTATCHHIQMCMRDEDVHKIDSLFETYMKINHFKIEYSFQVRQPNAIKAKDDNIFVGNIYKKRLDEIISPKGLELHLIIPKKKQFILAEMGTMFITAVILILAVIFMFWRTILSLIKEKKISENTRDFLNNMTHELKTPLTNIALATKMMTKEGNYTQIDKIKHYSHIILEENEKLRLQIEQVLNMAALERGEIPLHRTELDVHQLIHKAIKYMQIQIEHKQGNVCIDFRASNVVIMGDRTHLHNALCNLLDNAIKYAKEKPDITIHTRNTRENVQIVVEDKGIGIEKEYQQQVFEKFFRVPTGDVHDVKGFGLGLTYIKNIVKLHKGSIELHSEKGKGTTFIITIPYV